jgi:SAM-dependent methyltransferase
MRYSGKIKSISYSATREFFEARGRGAQIGAPETATMYQDGDLARRRDIFERELVLPLLKLNKSQRVLDIGCGYGRWAKAIHGLVNDYVGIDFSAELLRVAEGLAIPRTRFVRMQAQDVCHQSLGDEKKFDLFICSGILIYLNDEDVERIATSIGSMASSGARVYLREPMAVKQRLTLDRFPSAELMQEYSAIYRTVNQCKVLFGGRLIDAGFCLEMEAPLFPEGLCNRAETEQHIQFWAKSS